MKDQRQPELIIRIPLEGTGRVIIAADTHEDELRLRGWLRRTHRLDYLAGALLRLLDDLDEADRSAA